MTTEKPFVLGHVKRRIRARMRRGLSMASACRILAPEYGMDWQTFYGRVYRPIYRESGGLNKGLPPTEDTHDATV